MIKECNLYYSTLSDELYADKSDAKKAEDEYVANYFKALEREANRKRRMMRAIVQDSHLAIHPKL